jgi:uncharacterized protein YjbJ (UPF0337 family)
MQGGNLPVQESAPIKSTTIESRPISKPLDRVQRIDLVSIAFIVMSNKVDAAAKDAEGKMESALGDITGDKGHQIKGQAKQVQASVMNATEDLKEAAQSLARKVTGSTEKNTDDVS